MLINFLAASPTAPLQPSSPSKRQKPTSCSGLPAIPERTVLSTGGSSSKRMASSAFSRPSPPSRWHIGISGARVSRFRRFGLNSAPCLMASIRITTTHASTKLPLSTLSISLLCERSPPFSPPPPQTPLTNLGQAMVQHPRHSHPQIKHLLPPACV